MKNLDNNTTTQNTAGGGFLGLLTILFIGLKLTGFIDWPWIWVLGPLWIPVVSILAILLFSFLGILIMSYFENRK